MSKLLVLMLLGVLVLSVAPAAAQDRSPVIVEGAAGVASFIDDVTINYGYFGASGRLFVTPRVAVGPEIMYMNGPDIDRLWHFTGNVTFDLVADDPAGARRIVPYVVAAGGIQRMTHLSGTGPFTSHEGSFSGGVGARVNLSRRFFVAPEVRMGWEPHFRFGATFGARF